MTVGKCSLCAQVAGDREHDLLAPMLPGTGYQRGVARDMGHFALIPSVGPLAAGHVLLCPQAHRCSFAALGPDEEVEVEPAIDATEDLLSRRYGPRLYLFEHGTGAASSQPACSVEHAHLHLLPSRSDLWPAVAQAVTWSALGDRSLTDVVGDREYLRFRQDDGRWWIHVPRRPLRSQLLRQHLARALGVQHVWDWRTHPRAELVRETFDTVAA
jgi:diadenosine tetraphosphate (Ap4A) HIT family hydrolase